MSRGYVEVPWQDMLAELMKAGFRQAPGARSEFVFERAFPDRPLVVVVYTGFSMDGAQRGRGEDAIRVALVWLAPKGERRGLKKFPRVHRTGSVEATLGRMIGRARDAWRLGLSAKRCRACGSPWMPGRGCVDFSCGRGDRRCGSCGDVKFLAKSGPHQRMLCEDCASRVAHEAVGGR